MSYWKDLDIETKIRTILSKKEVQGIGSSLGSSFVTVYQIAIEFAKDYPKETELLGFNKETIGGKGLGQSNSLTQYLALQLGQHMSEMEKWLEGSSISNCHLKDILFENDIRSSLTGTSFPLSIFRLKPKS